MEIRRYYETYWSEDGFYPVGSLAPALASIFAQYVPAGRRCLDIGCGDGQTAGPWLLQNGCQYVGVDISGNAVRAAQAVGLDARQIEDASALPFEDDSFDAAICVEVLEHLFQPSVAVGEARRVLRPGGVLLVTVPNVAYWRRRVDLALLGRWNPLGDTLSVTQPWRDPHIRFFNPGALKRMLVAAGLEPIVVGGHGGSFLRDIPWVGRRLGSGGSSQFYRLGERVMPSFFGYRVHAVARKPLVE
ncbi:MAG: class I SAM-dependent methyltransferase [Dehalococcoidia bacterium]